jgi:RNA polymerase sigma factor (sigma-70 family)
VQPLSGPSDRELVHRILSQGDERAFRRLHDRHAARLHRLATNLAAGSSIDPLDLVQEMWMRAAPRLPSFEWRSSLVTWLSGILVNSFRESQRSDRRMPFVELIDEGMEWPAPPDPTERLELERAVASLAPGARTVLVLHDIEGYTHEEIAGFLEISPGTSKSQLCRARRAVVSFLTHHRKTMSHVRT